MADANNTGVANDATDKDSAADEESGKIGDSETIEISSATEAEKRIFLSAVQPLANEPVLQLVYSYDEFDFVAFRNLKIGCYYGDRVLEIREMSTLNSSLLMNACFGRVTARVTGKNAAGEDVILKEGIIPVCANEYNIASMNGSMPVLYFSLDLFTRNDIETRSKYENEKLPVMSNVPTIIALERVNSYDWEELPDNCYWLPALENPTGDFHGNNVIMANYIRELYEINPGSRFNFYCVDNYPELILKFFVAQGIENYHATLISDGTYSVTCFKRMTYPDALYGTDADDVYGKLAAEWKRIKAAAAEGDTDYLSGVFMGNSDAQILDSYAFVIATLEKNVDWWIARESLLTENANSDYILDLLKGTNLSGKNIAGDQTNVLYPAFNKMFTNLSAASAAGLKSLYKFDSDTFSSAGEKKVLMVLGTRTDYEGDLENYLTYLQKIYGDTYKIFYKGHPGSPTALDAEKKAMLDRLDIVDIESYIAAEIILFYCPDIYLAGYDSSTFYSAQNDHILTVFVTKTIGETKTYSGLTYINPVSSYEDVYASHAGCYVIEYKDSNRVDIYDPTSGDVTTITPAT